jgi:hypothetical protein
MPAKRQQEASDTEITDFLIYHIDNPCTVNVGGRTENIRQSYIREAERLLDESNKNRLTDPNAIRRLKAKIAQYKK